MKDILRLSGWILLIFCLVASFAACGDEELDGQDQNDTPSNQQPDPDNQNQPDPDQDNGEDCADDEVHNPITGECVPAGSDNQSPDNQNNHNQPSACDDIECDEGLICDPTTTECVECIGDGHCEVGFVCESNECVPDDEPQDCNSDDDCEDGQHCDQQTGQCEGEEILCGPGGIIGETCTATDGVLPGATVIVEGYDCDGVFFSMDTIAGSDGSYEFTNIPSGSHQLTIASGSFEITDDVSVQAGEVTDRKSVGHKLCFMGTEVDIAVASGSFDNIRVILDNMNIEYDTITNNSSFFSDLDQMRQYDIIFAECGTDSMGLGSGGGFGSDTDEIAYNIRRYVEEGNSLYASDWASHFVRHTIPEAMVFSDSTGRAPQTVMSSVESDLMQLVLDSNTAEVHFNAGGWHMMKDVGPSTEVQFRGSAESSGGPLLEDIPFMAIYDDPIGGGRAIYTSFHNNNQATNDMEDILEFMIFQL